MFSKTLGILNRKINFSQKLNNSTFGNRLIGNTAILRQSGKADKKRNLIGEKVISNIKFSHRIARRRYNYCGQG